MNDKPFSFDEFSKPAETVSPVIDEASDAPATELLAEDAELDVQKAVVEELAADKVAIESQFEEAKAQSSALTNDLANARNALNEALAESSKLRGEIIQLRNRLAEQDRQLAVKFQQEYEQESRNPNALALLDREVELPDRFPGETRDHVLEVIREARDAAEQAGRLRRAQILESVLVANEPNGLLAKRREELKQLFAENMNVVNGVMIERLTELNIPYKNGEEYLTADEIIRRTY